MSTTMKNKETAKKRESYTRKQHIMAMIYFVLVVVVVGVLIRQFMMGRYEHCFTCLLTLLLFMIPSFVEKRLKIDLPNTLEVIILLFIFSAEILGEIAAFYLRVPWWDTVLHTINGFLMAAIGVSMVDILNQREVFQARLSPLFLALVAFCFSMTIGVLWEFFEYGMDMIMKTDMQKDMIVQTLASVELNPDNENVPVLIKGIENVILCGENMTVNGALKDTYSLGLGGYLELGIIDTMQDLFVNFIGAVVFSVIGFFYVKHRGKGGWIRRLIPHKIRDEEK